MSALPQQAPNTPPTVLVVAGEPSSDHHGAALVKAVRQLVPGAQIFGMGGSHMRREGVDTVVDSERSASVMGVTELFGSLRQIVQAFKTVERAIDERRPAVAVLIDYPDFNLRLARVLKQRGVKVLYYISPQLWAWRRGRIEQMKRWVDRIAVIFPFEAEFYRNESVAARYVGHPFLDEPWPTLTRSEFLHSVGVSTSGPILAFLPGSRRGEVERLLPSLMGAFTELQRDEPTLQCFVPVAPGLDPALFHPYLRPGVHLLDGRARELLTVADAAVVTSGTATVEAALSTVPFVAVYRMAPLTYRIARLLVRGVKNFAMANLIAGEKVVEELLQDEVTPTRIAAELKRFLGNPDAASRTRNKLAQVRLRLEQGRECGQTAAGGAAQMVAELLKETAS